VVVISGDKCGVPLHMWWQLEAVRKRRMPKQVVGAGKQVHVKSKVMMVKNGKLEEVDEEGGLAAVLQSFIDSIQEGDAEVKSHHVTKIT